MPGWSRQTGLWCVPPGTGSLDRPPRWHQELRGVPCPTLSLGLTTEGGVEVGFRTTALIASDRVVPGAPAFAPGADPWGSVRSSSRPRGRDSRAAVRAWEGALGLCRPRPAPSSGTRSLAWTTLGAAAMALARCVLAVILGALPAVASVDPASNSPLHRPQTSPPRPQHSHYLPSSRPPRTLRFPLPPRVPAAQRPQVLTARHTPPRLPRGCGAGELWGNTTDLGAPCLHWTEVPPFLERSPPASWAELRGQPHNFCRSPDGAGRPWCFYRNAQGKVDWSYCDCSQGEWCPGRGGN